MIFNRTSWRSALVTLLLSLSVCTLADTKATEAEASTAESAQTDTASVAQTADPQVINRIVAIVNNGVITQDQLDAAMKTRRNEIESNGLTPPDDNILARQVLQQLILLKITSQLAEINGLSMSDQEIDQAIATIARRNGISRDKLERMIVAGGTTLDAYKENIRQQMLMQKLEQQAVANSIMVTPSEIDNYIKERAKQGNPDDLYQVEHILLSFPEHPSEKTIGKLRQKAQHIMQEVQDNQISFKDAAVKYSSAGDADKGGDLGWKTLNELPSAFAKAVVKIEAGELYGPIQTSTGFSIIKLVDKKNPPAKQHFVEQYHLQKILIQLSPVVDSMKAQASLKHVVLALKNGESFAKLAQDYNQDVATQESDGNMGWVALGQLDPTVAGVVEHLKNDQVSEPFETKDGWMIIQLLGKRQKDNTDNYEKEQAARTLFQEKARKAVATWQAKIKGESYIRILMPDLKPDADDDNETS